MDRLTLLLIGIYLTIVGILTVTNIDVTWSRPIMGFSALAAGVVCLMRGLRT